METLEFWRDIAVIVLAVMNLVWLLALLVVLLLIYRKLGPLLTSATSAVQNIQGTTTFIAETTVSPIIRAISFITGIKAAAGTIGRMGKKKS